MWQHIFRSLRRKRSQSFLTAGGFLLAACALILLKALGEIRQRGGFSTPLSNAFANQGLPLGTQAPAFSAKTSEGSDFNLAEIDGKWRVLTFISPGCSACESALKTLQDFQQERQD